MRLLPLLLLPLGCSGSDDKDTGTAPADTAPADTDTDTDTDTDADTDTDTDTDTDADTDADTDTDTGPVDADGDGFPAEGGDCDDRNPDVHPGAVERCNGYDDDCDATTSEDGTAALRDPGGAWTDITAALAAGSRDEPAILGDSATDHVFANAGTAYLCAGTWHTKVVLADPASDLLVVAPAGARRTTLTTSGTSGGEVGSIVAVTNSTLTLQGFTIAGGTGSIESSTQGGGVVVSQTTGGALPAVPNLTLIDSVVTRNEADYGGGVAIRGLGWLALEDTRIEGNDATYAGGGAWVQNFGHVSCAASALGAAGIADNFAPIAGGLYLSSSAGGTVDTRGCDWGADADDDDNVDYDIQQQPASSNRYCYGNATSLADTVTCDGSSCTASTDATCP